MGAFYLNFRGLMFVDKVHIGLGSKTKPICSRLTIYCSKQFKGILNIMHKITYCVAQCIISIPCMNITDCIMESNHII